MADPNEAMRRGRSLRIIHLSDLHFGNHHRFGGEIAPAGDYVAGGPSLAESIRKDLESVEPGTPQIVCVTGDLTQTASPDEFGNARLFCKELCSGDASLGPLAVVPGNHDVDWERNERTDRMRPWSQFLTELRGAYDDWSHGRRDAMVRTELIESHGVIIVEVNSAAWVQRGTPDTHRGRVSQDALVHLKSELSKLKELDPEVFKSCVKIALVHHHPILIPDLAEPGRGYDSIHGAGHLLRILRNYRFHLLLHGHKHVPFTFTEDSLSAQEDKPPYPIFVICGGSASSNELPDDRPPINCYNQIEIKWLPDARQYRCRVETRELVRTNNRGVPLIPAEWTWRALSREDRSIRPERSFSGNVPPYRPFRQDDDDDQSHESRRKKQYELNRGVFPTLAVRPNLTPGQVHEAIVELRHHRPPAGTVPKQIKSVRWSAGPNHSVYELQKDSAPRFRAAFGYYDSMLIQASVTWEDDFKADLFIYAQREEIEQ